MTIDDLLAAEVVTADGEMLQVDDETHPDLFWAIRGGGGNFGVATRFQFRLHEVPSIVGGILMLPATPEVITAFIARGGGRAGGADDDRERDEGAADAVRPRGASRRSSRSSR